MSQVDIAQLATLHDWMREHGVVRARAGDVELLLGPAPAPKRSADPELAQADEQAAKDAKRRKALRLQLGREPTDHEMKVLP
jgi:hypothetical protein